MFAHERRRIGEHSQGADPKQIELGQTDGFDIAMIILRHQETLRRPLHRDDVCQLGGCDNDPPWMQAQVVGLSDDGKCSFEHFPPARLVDLLH